MVVVENTRTRALLTALAVLALPGVACGLMYTVDCTGGGDFTEVQAAVDFAADGDTLLLLPCVYTECVEILEKELTILGSGAATTEIASATGCPALTIVVSEHYLNLSATVLRDITLSGASSPTVFCEFGRLVLQDCVVQGGSVIGTDYTPSFWDADLEAYDCILGTVNIYGHDYLPSVMERCRAVGVRIHGFHAWPGYGAHAALHSRENTMTGWLDVSGGVLTSQGDSTSYLHVVDPNPEMADATISDMRANFVICEMAGGDVEISASVIDSMWYWGWDFECDLLLVGTCVRGRSEIRHTRWGAVELIHNTFLKPLDLRIENADVGHAITSNVFYEELSGNVHATVPMSYNCFGEPPSMTGGSLQSNMTADPLLCDPESGSCELQDCSPCIGSAHDGGHIGACGIGCSCSSPVEEQSWGGIKWGYR